jgi:N-acetylneuraminic acid mutarotase
MSPPPVARRPIAMGAVAASSIVLLIALRLIADGPSPAPVVAIPSPTEQPTTPSGPPTPEQVRLVAGQWRKLPTSPPGIYGWSGVWTGRAMIIWSGRYQQKGLGYAYMPESNRWRPIASTRVGGTGGAAAAWTGSEMIIWGGDGGVDGPPSRIGAAYNPASDRWREIAQAPLKGGLDHTAVWTGSEMIVWGMTSQGETQNEAAAYDPRADTWRSLPAAPLTPRQFATVAWTSSEMIVWGGGGGLVDGAAYSPESDRWRAISPAPISGRSGPGSVWTGTELIVWGGGAWAGEGVPGPDLSDGARYNPSSDRWTLMAGSPLSPRRSPQIVWTPRGAFIWAGQGAYVEGSDDEHFGRTNDGAVYDPVTDAWRMLPRSPLGRRIGRVAVFTGKVVLLWGGCCPDDGFGYADGASFSFAG